MNAWALLGTAVTGLLLVVVEWIKLGQAQATGGKLVAAKVTAVTANAEVAIAQAEVDAPATREAVVDRLNKGTF